MLYTQSKRLTTSFEPILFVLSFGILSLMFSLTAFPFSFRIPASQQPPTPPSFPYHIASTPKQPTPTKATKQITPVTNKQTIAPMSQMATTSSEKLLFGMGSEADGAVTSRLVQNTPTKMLTSWYNGPQDLTWMTTWKNTLIPDLYAKGYTLHLITFTDYPETTFTTSYGPACGREYPLSAKFLTDMQQLADTYKGQGPLYVTLFTEFQTYPCTDNVWNGNEHYFSALKDQYLAAKKIFKDTAPNANVAISWGGWQTRWDDQAAGGGRSLFPHFSDIMQASDFTAFQAMESGTNVQDIKDMTKTLASYRRPVMLSHYKPDNGSQTTFDADIKSIFTDAFIKEVTDNGLFAFSFMDHTNLTANEGTYQTVASGVTKYANLKP